MDGELITNGVFDAAFRWLMAAEGGYSNHPLDHGGATNRGITRRSWADYTHRDIGEVTEEEMQAITLDQARSFYRDIYWRPLGGDEIARYRPASAIALFDVAVLHGMPRAVRMAQSCLDGVQADGLIGPLTRNKIINTSEVEFLCRYVRAVTLRLVGIIETDASQSVFMRAWIGRSLRLLSLIEA